MLPPCSLDFASEKGLGRIISLVFPNAELVETPTGSSFGTELAKRTFCRTEAAAKQSFSGT